MDVLTREQSTSSKGMHIVVPLQEHLSVRIEHKYLGGSQEYIHMYNIDSSDKYIQNPTCKAHADFLMTLTASKLHYVHSCFAIILMGKREPVTLLSSSSCCLVIVVWLFLAMP